MANIIYSAWNQGARFDGWDETFNYDLWVKCVEESGLNTETFLRNNTYEWQTCMGSY